MRNQITSRGSFIARLAIAFGAGSILVFAIAQAWFSNYQTMNTYTRLLNGGVALLLASVLLGIIGFIRGGSTQAPRALVVKSAFGLAIALLASFATFVGLVVYALTHCPDGLC